MWHSNLSQDRLQTPSKSRATCSSPSAAIVKRRYRKVILGRGPYARFGKFATEQPNRVPGPNRGSIVESGATDIRRRHAGLTCYVRNVRS